jgi:hypothetical protein
MPIEDAVRFITLVNEFSPHREQHWQKFKDEAKQIYEQADDADAHLYGGGFPTLLKNVGEEHRETLADVLKLLGLEKPKTEEEERGLPNGFSVIASGVYSMSKPDDDDEPKAFRVCSKLDVISIVQSRDEDESGLEIAWNDMNTVRRTWTLPRNLLHNDASAVREELLRRGFQFIDPSKRGKELFVRYLMGCNPPKRKQSVSRVGWHGESYVTPTTVFAKKKDVEIVFQSPLTQRYIFQSGTLAEWQDNVSRKCIGNSHLLFMASTAFAAPLMPFANAESGGFNFVGTSSSGKTTALSWRPASCRTRSTCKTGGLRRMGWRPLLRSTITPYFRWTKLPKPTPKVSARWSTCWRTPAAKCGWARRAHCVARMNGRTSSSALARRTSQPT